MKTQNILFVIQHGNKIGFINKKGEEVITPQFTNNQYYHHKTGAVDFSDLVPVKKVSKWGFIDKTGAFKVQPKYDLVGKFNGNLAFVGKKYESESAYPEIPDCIYGYINRTGEKVIGPLNLILNRVILLSQREWWLFYRKKSGDSLIKMVR